jgi:hypothetical protein
MTVSDLVLKVLIVFMSMDCSGAYMAKGVLSGNWLIFKCLYFDGFPIKGQGSQIWRFSPWGVWGMMMVGERFRGICRIFCHAKLLLLPSSAGVQVMPFTFGIIIG